MRRILSCLTLLVGAACAAAPDPVPAGGPAGPAARQGYAAVLVGAAGREAGLGSAVAIDDRHALTSRHVLRHDGGAVQAATLVRDDGARATAILVGRSEAMDLAVLRLPAGFLAPARLAPAGPLPAQPVWAAGWTGAGPGLAAGWVLEHDAAIDGLGPGFIARLGAPMGFSGGPVVGPDGAVVGLTTARLAPGGAPPLGLTTGPAAGPTGSEAAGEVFVLGIGPALAEARRLIASAGR